MLLELFRSLADGFPALNVFNYLTLRAVLAALTSMGIGFALGPWMIARLKNLHFGQAVRTDGPKTHLVKDGTPTMGGALILFAITVSTLLWADLSNRFIWVVLFVTLGYGSIGWIDDYRKVVHHNPKGMSAREKFSWQSVIGLAAAFYLVFALSVPAGGTLTETIAGWVEAGFPLDISSNLHLLIPCFKDIALPLGLVGFMVFTYVVIVGSSNAVNLTDGLDGLAILPENDTLYAPCDGEVTVLMDESRHACGLTLENGMEILLHIGIDTVEMQGDGFEYLVSLNQKVKQGTPLVRFDREKIRTAGHPDVTVCIVTEEGNAKDFEFVTDIHAEAGKTEIVLFN